MLYYFLYKYINHLFFRLVTLSVLFILSLSTYALTKEKRINLAPNIINGRSILSSEMLINSQTTYVIHEKYDLKGRNIQIPTGCTLFFDGGSFANGTIIGDNTKIACRKTDILFHNIKIKGTWNVSNIYSKWFDFSLRKHNTEDLKNISKLQNDSVHNHIYFHNIEIAVSLLDREDLFVLTSNTVVDFDKAKLFVTSNSNHGSNLILIKDKSNVEIKGGFFKGDIRSHKKIDKSISDEWNHCLCIKDGSVNVRISGMHISEFFGDGIDLVDSGLPINNKNPKEITIKNCILDNNGRQAISIESGINVLVENCQLTNTGKIHKTKPSSGLDIEPYNPNAIIKNILIKDCKIKGNANNYDVLFFYRKDFKYDYPANISMQNCVTGNIYGQNRKGISILDCYSSSLTTDNCDDFICKRTSLSDVLIKNSNKVSFTYCTFTNIDQNFVTNFVIKNCHGQHLLFTNCKYCTIENSKFSSSDLFTCRGKIIGRLHLVNSLIENTNKEGKLFEYLYSADNNISILDMCRCRLNKISRVDETWNGIISFHQNEIKSNGMTIKCISKFLRMTENTIIGGNAPSTTFITIPVSSKILWLNNKVEKGYSALLDGNLQKRSSVLYSSKFNNKLTNYPNSLTVDKLCVNNVRSGYFVDKPISPKIDYQYYCIDKVMPGSLIPGVLIYYKGNNIWVDALGRQVK